jgi:Bacteroidetes VLRF1 release factor
VAHDKERPTTAKGLGSVVVLFSCGVQGSAFGPHGVPKVVRFAWTDLAEQIQAFAARWPEAKADRRGLVFHAPAEAALLRVPLAATRVLPGENVRAYANRLEVALGRQVIVLLQAGAVALGYWDGEELVRHKAMRKYVVRGHGKAQPTHLKTRGKSRYGARLRLQNWQRLLAETNVRLREYWHELGPPDRVFHAAPVRGWVDLFTASPSPPFGRDAAPLQRLPMHVHRPDFAELQRVRGWLLLGRLELPR